MTGVSAARPVSTDPRSLLEFVDASPTPFHVGVTVAGLLTAAGLTEVTERSGLPLSSAGHFLVRGGTLVAWRGSGAPDRFRIVAAHTDSPGLRVRPNPDLCRSGLWQLGVEVYGGPMLNSWLDRDLGLAGRVSVSTGAGVDTRLFSIDRPLLRIPQLAIHLDRDIGSTGLLLNRQQHLAPLWAGEDAGADFVAVLAEQVGVASEQVLAWDAMLVPVEPSRLLGLHEEFVSAPRLDNQLSCWAGTSAFAAAAAAGPAVPGVTDVLVLFDHEEVGSVSERGAAGGFLGSVLERIAAGTGQDRAGYLTALSQSLLISADSAHATNPNYPERHEPYHQIDLDGGPVLKINSNLRYATDAVTAAVFVQACRRADVPVQSYVARGDLPCGSTIGPPASAVLAVPTVDVGTPQLAMHSARELCGAAAPGLLAAALYELWVG